MATKRPLIRDATTGLVSEIAAPDTIDPSVLPAAGSGSETFSFFMGG